MGLDDSAVGRFWAETLGWGVSSEEPGVTNVGRGGFDWRDPVGVCVDRLRDEVLAMVRG